MVCTAMNASFFNSDIVGVTLLCLLKLAVKFTHSILPKFVWPSSSEKCRNHRSLRWSSQSRRRHPRWRQKTLPLQRKAQLLRRKVAAVVSVRVSMGRHSAAHAGKATALMSSGSAATSARSGSMASASRSRQPRPSTSSTTSARPARVAAAAASEPARPKGKLQLQCCKLV